MRQIVICEYLYIYKYNLIDCLIILSTNYYSKHFLIVTVAEKLNMLNFNQTESNLHFTKTLKKICFPQDLLRFSIILETISPPPSLFHH